MDQLGNNTSHPFLIVHGQASDNEPFLLFSSQEAWLASLRPRFYLGMLQVELTFGFYIKVKKIVYFFTNNATDDLILLLLLYLYDHPSGDKEVVREAGHPTGHRDTTGTPDGTPAGHRRTRRTDGRRDGRTEEKHLS